MKSVKAYAAEKAKAPLKPFNIQRRDVGVTDVEIEIQYCGICHSDVHQARNDWGHAKFPMVPGHEIVGIVKAVGNAVKKFKVGDHVGVGCFVNSCCQCAHCKVGAEQYCEKGPTWTYNGLEQDGKTHTFGGYSEVIVVDENYVLKIPKNLPLDKAAPLLCAGITTYSPLIHWKIKSGSKVAVMGLGGLGHMAVKIANALGAEVTVLSTSDSKKDDALKMGAKHFINTKENNWQCKNANSFDFILNTISADINLDVYLNLLKLDGTMILVGLPQQPIKFNPFSLTVQRRRIGGSFIGGIKETQEMLNFCAAKNIACDIELISIDKVNEAYERLMKGDVRYRFVIDMKTLI